MPDTLAPSVTDVVELTRALVRCESVTPREAGALQHLERTLEPLGFRCERMDFSQAGTDDVANLYARIGKSGRHFCFAGHSDVVPVGDLSSWTIGPFSAELSAGYLFGRGAADMKGAIAAFTEACARFLGRRGRDFGGSISLLITGDEEGPAVNGTVKMLKRLAERGETIDACVVGEPTSSRRFGDMMKIGRRGSMNVEMVVRGVQGHVGYPERLDNPIHRLSALIEALVREPIDQGSALFQPSSLQFTTVDVGNKATNIAPGTVRARFNTRFNELWTSKTLLALLQERLDRAHARLGGNGTIELSAEVSGESFFTPPGPLSELVAGAIRDVAGIEPELSTTGGTSDARFIRSYCPVLEFGLVGETMHKVDEKSAVDDLRTLSRVYETVLDRYFSPLGWNVLTSAEIARGVQGALGLLQRDPSALLKFDNTMEACLRSFRVMVVAAPFYALYALINYANVTVEAEILEVVLIEATRYVIEWLLYPVLFYEVARRRGWVDRFPRYIGALNWINLPATVIATVGVTVESLAPGVVAVVIDLGLRALFFYWFLVTTRMALGSDWLISVVLLLVNWVPSFFLSFIVARYVGIIPVAGT